MAAVAKGVAMSLGLITTSVSLYTAIEASKTGNKNVCCGTTGQPEHDPIPVSQVNKCSTCGDMAYTDIKKGRPVGDGFVLLDATDIEEAKADATTMKKVAALTPSHAAEVEVAMVSGDKLYFAVPDPGHEATYAILRHLVKEHPELAFMCQWTPRTNAGVFRVIHRDGTLLMAERVRPGRVKKTPVVTADAPEAMLAMAEQVLSLPGVVTDFDPDTYVDTYETRLADIIATKQIVASGGVAPTSTTPALPAGQANAMAALEAMLAAAAPAPAPVKTRKAKATA